MDAISTPSAPQHLEQASTTEVNTQPSILLVEDEPITRTMTSRQLRRAGYEVQAVSNGSEALAMLETRFFPLLLTDWDMPEMDGVALCKAVRALPLEGYVYTILLSSREGKASIIEGLAAGADDYLTKPPDDNELRARLNTGRRILQLERSLRTANRRIHLLSITDVLTGTYNRRQLLERLPQELERAARYERPVSVVMCDIDHFKKVNDTHGHQVGDDVLKGFAKLLLESTRQDIDWVARYGGEEFLIVLPETSPQQAAHFAEKIRSALAVCKFEIPGGTLTVSSSFGVAGCEAVRCENAVGVERLIAEADRCLYRSKALGRDRVTVDMLA